MHHGLMLRFLIFHLVGVNLKIAAGLIYIIKSKYSDIQYVLCVLFDNPLKMRLPPSAPTISVFLSIHHWSQTRPAKNEKATSSSQPTKTHTDTNMRPRIPATSADLNEIQPRYQRTHHVAFAQEDNKHMADYFNNATGSFIVDQLLKIDRSYASDSNVWHQMIIIVIRWTLFQELRH